MQPTAVIGRRVVSERDTAVGDYSGHATAHDCPLVYTHGTGFAATGSMEPCVPLHRPPFSLQIFWRAPSTVTGALRQRGAYTAARVGDVHGPRQRILPLSAMQPNRLSLPPLTARLGQPPPAYSATARYRRATSLLHHDGWREVVAGFTAPLRPPAGQYMGGQSPRRCFAVAHPPSTPATPDCRIYDNTSKTSRRALAPPAPL